MIKKIIKQLSLVSLIALSFFAFAFKDHLKVNQSFSGNWKLNVEQSDNSQATPKELKIKLTSDSIFIERITNDNQSFIEKMSFDEKPNNCITTSGRRKSGSAKWDEKEKSFTETATLGDTGDTSIVAFNVTEHWELSDDKTQLTVLTTLTNSSGASGQRKDVYDRQN